MPSGCTAYYAFDDTVTTESTRYTGPVEMPEGEHIFSAILVNKNGKISLTASETYVFYQWETSFFCMFEEKYDFLIEFWWKLDYTGW